MGKRRYPEGMRRLLLLRHAETAAPPGVDDRHRPLTQKGANDALELGRVMKERGYVPDFTICSPARRTQQTWRKLQDSFGMVETVSPESAYFTTTGQLYELIKQVNPNRLCVLLVSHNPSIHTLARMLSGLGHGDLLIRLNGGYPPATLSVFKCPIDAWSNLMPSENDLEDMLGP